MRTTTATVHFTLKKRADKKGECPVICIIRHNNSRAERSTGVKVPPSKWNARTERVRASHPNAKQLNLLLNKYVTNMTTASASMAASGESVTPQKVADCMSDVPRSSSGVTVSDAYRLYLESRVLAPATVQTYHDSLTRLRRYQKRDALLADVSVKLVGGWVQSMLSEGVAGSSVHQYVRNFLAVVRYASRIHSIKLDMDELIEPLKKVSRKPSGRRVVMSSSNAESMAKWLCAFSERQLSDRPSPCCSAAIFWCAYVLGGVAQTDMATMKAADFIVNDKYIAIKGSRRKTGIQFGTPVPMTDEVRHIFGAFFRTAHLRDGYLFPMVVGGCCRKVDMDDKAEVHKAVDRWCVTFGRKFPKAIEELNRTLEESERLPSGMTFYSARHSFAGNFVKKSNNLGALCTIMGRSPNTIATYLRELSSEDELLRERLKIGI